MQRYHPGLGLVSLLGGMGLGWWALTIAPDVLSVLRFGTVGAVQLPTRYTLLACSVGRARRALNAAIDRFEPRRQRLPVVLSRKRDRRLPEHPPPLL